MPHEDRYGDVFITLDRRGNVNNVELSESVINSKQRLDYVRRWQSSRADSGVEPGFKRGAQGF